MGKKAREKKYRVARKMAELGVPPEKAKELLAGAKMERRLQEKNRTGGIVVADRVDVNGVALSYKIVPRNLNVARWRKGQHVPRSLAFPRMLNGKLIV